MENPSEQMKNAINNSKLSTVQELLNFLSVEAVYNLLKNLGGCTYTFLAKKYALSSRQIRMIINK